MARVVITSTGTMGDFVPFIALGRRLRRRGHDVIMAINPAMIGLANRAGLEAVPCGRAFGPDDARREASAFDESAGTIQENSPEWLRRLNLRETYEELRAAIRGAGLLVSSSLQGLAPWVHEATGIPWVNATIFPMEFQTGRESRESSSGEIRSHWRAIFDHRNAVRRAVKLPPLADDEWRDYYWSDRLVLIATSEHFCQLEIHDRPQARITGFWFDDPAVDGWEPDPELKKLSSTPKMSPQPRRTIITRSAVSSGSESKAI
jgi:UDP:flavonoid glycosyltransferase YjiC (YdhE family)